MGYDITKKDVLEELQFLAESYDLLINRNDTFVGRYKRLKKVIELAIEAVEDKRPEGYWEPCEPDYDRDGTKILKRGAHCSECGTYDPRPDRYCGHCGSYNEKEEE